MRLLDQAAVAILAEGNKNSGCNPAAAKRAGNVCGRPPKDRDAALREKVRKTKKTPFGRPKPVEPWQRSFYQAMQELDNVDEKYGTAEGMRKRATVGEEWMARDFAIRKKAGKHWWNTEETKGKGLSKFKELLFMDGLEDYLEEPQDMSDAADDLLRKNSRKRRRTDIETRRQASAILDTITHAPMNSTELTRGIHIEGSPESVLARVKAGEHLDIPLASFSESEHIAKQFAEGQNVMYRTEILNRKRTPVLMKLRRGTAKALNISGIAEAYEQLGDEKEWLSSGRFKIDQVEVRETQMSGIPISGLNRKGKLKYIVLHLKQRGVFSKLKPRVII